MSQILIRTRAAALRDHYVIVTLGDSIVTGTLVRHNDTTLTLAHHDVFGAPTAPTIIQLADVTDIMDFYDDFDDED